MKDNEQYFPVVLFVMLYKVVITFESVGEILKCDVGMQMKTAKQYFAVVLFIMLCKVVLVCGYNFKLWPFKWKLFIQVLTSSAV